MVKEGSVRKKRKTPPKNEGVVSMIVTEIENLQPNEKPLAMKRFKDLVNLNIPDGGTEVHQHTIRKRLTEAALWMSLYGKVKFIMEDNWVVMIQKLEEEDSDEVVFKKELGLFHEKYNLLKDKVEGVEGLVGKVLVELRNQGKK